MKSFFSVLSVALCLVALTGCEAMKKADAPKGSKSSASKANKHMPVAEGAMVCSKGAEKRTIENKSTASGGCEVVYTKGGAAQTVATAVKGNDHCGAVAGKIKGNLSAAGWSCN